MTQMWERMSGSQARRHMSKVAIGEGAETCVEKVE